MLARDHVTSGSWLAQHSTTREHVTSARSWLEHSSAGSCGETSWHPPSDQCSCDDSGAFRLQRNETISWMSATTACLLRCKACPRCRHISVSLRWADCSWFSSCTTVSTEVQGFLSGAVHVQPDATSLPKRSPHCDVNAHYGCGWFRDCPMRALRIYSNSGSQHRTLPVCVCV